ncbi:DUF418 domain-containing protein [Akkermansiaceae bacterium]|nr:DUF418 domain-containing protein [Akkermansiaceae bacterium]
MNPPPFPEIATPRASPPPLPEHYGKPLAPVAAGERIASLDVLRGLALLGILAVNILHFSYPLEQSGLRGCFWLSPADRVTDWICAFLVEGKSYPLFSILFGLGFALQMDRAEARGLDHTAVYRRRLFILLGLGLAHGILLWDGDVLLPYAVCGFALLLFRKRKAVTAMVWAAALILLPALLILLMGLLFLGIPELSADMQETEQERSEMVRAFVTGDYADAVSYRLRELVFTILTVGFYAPSFLGLFLIGMVAGRERIITAVAENRHLLAKILVLCGAVGLAANFLGAWAMMSGSAGESYGLMFIGMAIISVFGPVLTAAYIAGIVLWIERRPSSVLLPPLAAVGRMALTNYLAQSLIATTIFYGYGFGLGGGMGRLGTLGIALLVFAVQVAFSVLWLKRFRYGPMEWLWRSLTYGKRQTLPL